MEHRSIDPFDLDESLIKAIGKDWMLITAAHPDGRINSMTASWGGVGHIWETPVAFAFIRPQRFTKGFVEASSTFSLCFFDGSYRKSLNFLGTASGFDDDEKVAHSGLTAALHQTQVLQPKPPGGLRVEQTPYLDEARLVLICERLYQQDMLEECFLDKSLLKEFYGRVEGQSDLHTLYVAAIRDVLLAD